MPFIFSENSRPVLELRSDQVIVTGALGWLGQRLVESLARGLPDHTSLRQPVPRLRIRALILPGQDPGPLQRVSRQIEIIAGDVRDASDCDRLCAGARDAVLFHTAGIIHPHRVHELYDVNVGGTENLIDAAARAGVWRAVVVSSNSPCGNNPHPDHLFDEQSPYRPYMNYGRSKMLMELAVRARQETGAIEAVLIRAPWFYGINQPPRQTMFFEMVRDGKAPIVGSGKNLRSMSYIDNLCQGLLLAAGAAHANGQVYWIADRRPYSMNEIIDTIERLLESEFGQRCSHKRLRLPGFASDVAEAVDSAVQSTGLYNQKIHVLSEMNKTIACSIGRAERELDYRPAVELEEGMRRSIQWCVDQGMLKRA
jgi:nucleoside-diphosphate-sugar epimerase